MWHQTPRGGFSPWHCFRYETRREDHLARGCAVLEDLLVVIDVVDEGVERVDALLAGRARCGPTRRRGTMRGIRSKGKMRSVPGGVAVDVEGDAHLQQQPLGGVLVAQQLAVGERFDGFQQQLGVRPRPRRSSSNISS